MIERLSGSEFDFNPEDYPERVSCKTVSSLEELSVEIELVNYDDEQVVIEVPRQALIPVPMPPLAENVPAVIRDVFEQGAGLAIVSCRIESLKYEMAGVVLPAISGPLSLIVPTKRIVRRVN